MPFSMLWPGFESYFELLRHLAGEEGPGSKLPVFDPNWVKVLVEGHERRKPMREKRNNEAMDRGNRGARILAKF